MRKLILEVQLTVDGYVADPNGKTDWQVWNWDKNWSWDDDLKKYFNDLMDSVDCILLSRKMAKEGFIEHWKQAATDPKDLRYGYAKKINKTHKVVFSKTLKETEWDNYRPGKRRSIHGSQSLEVTTWQKYDCLWRSNLCIVIN